MRKNVFVAMAIAGTLAVTSSARAATYLTSLHPDPSFITLEIWLGPPEGEIEGEPSVLASSIGPLAVTGSAEATVVLDGSGNGTLEITGASLILADSIDNFVDLMELGTTNASLIGVGMGVQGDPLAVAANVWEFDTPPNPPVNFSMALNQGLIELFDHTGFLALLPDPEILDLDDSPVSVDQDDLAGFGLFGYATNDTFGIIIPDITLDLGADALGLPGVLFIRLIGEVNLALIPEPSTYVLFGMSILGLVPIVRRRLRRK